MTESIFSRGSTWASPPNFDRLAGIYATIEWLAFGSALERARFCLLAELQDCRDILLLGDGDGRCLQRLTQVAPNARLHYVDASSAMLARAAARHSPEIRSRVNFTCADVFAWTPPEQHYDAVVTAFFLDCFTEDQVEELIARTRSGLRPGARWLWVDFILPDRGWQRIRAQVWLGVMYAFFRWQTNLAARVLPDSEKILNHAGWCAATVCDFHSVFVRAVLFSQPGCGS